MAEASGRGTWVAAGLEPPKAQQKAAVCSIIQAGLNLYSKETKMSLPLECFIVHFWIFGFLLLLHNFSLPPHTPESGGGGNTDHLYVLREENCSRVALL